MGELVVATNAYALGIERPDFRVVDSMLVVVPLISCSEPEINPVGLMRAKERPLLGLRLELSPDPSCESSRPDGKAAAKTAS